MKTRTLRSLLLTGLAGIVMLIVSCRPHRLASESISSNSMPVESDSPALNPPKVRVPKVNVPEINVPQINVPQIKTTPPAIPTIEIPEINIPEITLPEINVRQNPDYFVVTLPAEILFDFDRATLRTDALSALQQVTVALQTYHPDAPILVAGHTDNKGSPSYNQSLSERRANAVKRWLVTTGKLDEKRIVAEGYGESRPVAPNTQANGADNPSGRQQNRRVELIIQRSANRISN